MPSTNKTPNYGLSQWLPNDKPSFDDHNADNAIIDTLLPVGSIFSFAGAVAPAGYLLCQGQAVSITTYANLFAVIGATYGAGDGSTTFNLPDLRKRIPVGLDSTDTDFDALGKTGGSKKVTLTISEMPLHNHTFTGNALPGHTHSPTHNERFVQTSGAVGTNSVASTSGTQQRPYANGSDTFNSGSISSVSAGTPSGSIGSNGGNGAHDNMQPYVVMNYIIKY